VVCNVAVIKGDVKIGMKTIIHPCAKILATGGPIVIGDSNIIEELACIENRSKTNETLYIGNWNVFEVRSSVYASVIGDNNVFETNCVVGEEMAIGNACVFGVGTKVNNVKSCPDHSVFYGAPELIPKYLLQLLEEYLQQRSMALNRLQELWEGYQYQGRICLMVHLSLRNVG